VTRSTSAEEQRHGKKYGHHGKIDSVRLRPRHRYAAVCLIEEIYTEHPAVRQKESTNTEYPRQPDGILYPAYPLSTYRPRLYPGGKLLQGAGRANPAAEKPSKRHGEKKQNCKDQRASSHYSARCANNAEIGGEVVDGNRKEKQRYQQQGGTKPLSLLRLHFSTSLSTV